MRITLDEIGRRFDHFTIRRSIPAYHKLDPDDTAAIEYLRGEFKHVAIAVIGNTPAGREQSLALTKLEEALYWAIGAIVRDSQ